MYTKLAKSLDTLQKEAKGQTEVTAAMVKAKAKCPAGLRAIRESFHAHGVFFHKLREKPILRDEDVIGRHAFSKENLNKSGESWVAMGLSACLAWPSQPQVPVESSMLAGLAVAASGPSRALQA